MNTFAAEGSSLVFGEKLMNPEAPAGYVFAVQVLPTIIFFSAVTSLFFYWGVLQKVVYLLARLLKKVLPVSGAESLSAAGNVFLGQTESPLLIKPYLNTMTKFVD